VLFDRFNFNLISDCPNSALEIACEPNKHVQEIRVEFKTLERSLTYKYVKVLS
jgi:hypothetical protein